MLLAWVMCLLAGNQDASKLSKEAVLWSVLPAEFNLIFGVHCEQILAQSERLRREQRICHRGPGMHYSILCTVFQL